MGLVVNMLFVAAAFAIVVGFLIVYTRRVADVALTDQFRAGEAIVEGNIPSLWVVQIKRRQAFRGALRLFRRDATAEDLVLAKIDKLYRFYENNPFYENAEVRELLLTELRETRARWSEMTWEELLSEHDGGAHRVASLD